MGMPTEQQMVQMPIYPNQAPPLPEPDLAHQVLHWLEIHVWGGATTLLVSALIGLPIVLMFIFRAKVALILAPIAEFVLKISKKG